MISSVVEHLSYKEKVVGSNPTSPIRKVLISFRAFFNYLNFLFFKVFSNLQYVVI